MTTTRTLIQLSKTVEYNDGGNMDYTKQRKSKLIQVCPKCGRKGAFGRGLINEGRPNAKKYRIVKHVSSIVTLAGIQCESVTDSCMVEVQQ